MTTDERIEKLAEVQKKTQIMLAEIAGSIKRLERIALSRVSADDIDARLT
jgi:hypothetical protein